jgi:hypothetical protein
MERPILSPNMINAHLLGAVYDTAVHVQHAAQHERRSRFLQVAGSGSSSLYPGFLGTRFAEILQDFSRAVIALHHIYTVRNHQPEPSITSVYNRHIIGAGIDSGLSRIVVIIDDTPLSNRAQPAAD